MRTIGLLFDLHVMSDTHAECERREYDGVSRARRACEKLNEVGVDWTVVGGDLRTLASHYPERTDWGGWHDDPDNKYYRKDFRRAKALLDDELDGEYHPIRGNHDRPLSVWKEFFPPEEYPQWFHFREDGARYVFLDSNPHQGFHHLTQTQNFVTAPQLSMLERLMDGDPDVPTFVFCHAPLAKHTELHPDWETGYTSAYRFTLNYPSVQHLLERGNTVFVNSGHYSSDHGRETTEVNGVKYVIARHLGGSNPSYAGDVRWMTVDTDEREATVTYYDLATDEEGTLAEANW
ncbi:metallophosphoesterase family protein [Halorussus salinisoli]|uniref:metallophosphoesterase family protein n=1 Tax=Halorussus salinisoli TaxID=2558242 RepID=UPI0010C2285F|nr:metallophosphoesterase [Halorussus salinisoli]